MERTRKPNSTADCRFARRCGECKGYHANYCKTYDEVTSYDSEVQCVGFDPTDTCESCCYYDGRHCEFHGVDIMQVHAACEAWEPQIIL